MWPLKEVDQAAIARLSAESREPNLVCRLLWLRGVRDAESVRRWLNPSIEHLHPPELLPDFALAVARIKQAIERREPILLWGHDDLDGISSIVILYRLLTDLRADVRYHIPTRGRERHGLDAAAATDFVRDGVRLIVTVDCGITNRDQVELLRAQGIGVVVTDHHEVPEQMPDAVANVDAKRPDSRYPYRGLASAGVSLKLGLGLVSDRLGASVAEFLSVQPDLFAMAVLGTVADRVPLTGENRTLVVLGLRRLGATRIPAVRAVLEHVGTVGRLTLSQFVAGLLPFFAAARGNEAVDKFLNANMDDARAWVGELSAQSEEWRAEAERSYAIAQAAVRVGDGVLFACSRELSLRALGSCAARLKDLYQLPAIVTGWRGDAWVGECRGIDGVSLLDLLDNCRRFLIDYGGHKKAAGFTIADDQVAGFTRCAEEYAHEHFAGRIQPENVVRADAVLPVAEFDPALAVLAPFGDGNPPPVFVSDSVRLQPRDAGWAPEERPELSFRAPRREVGIEPGVPVRLLYTMDDLGELAVLSARPAVNGG